DRDNDQTPKDGDGFSSNVNSRTSVPSTIVVSTQRTLGNAQNALGTEFQINSCEDYGLGIGNIQIDSFKDEFK
ncbi:hypothetical protein HAX54_026119, partial [Datura stramonium]|nr:hypothetical protein [Datura stramonium]